MTDYKALLSELVKSGKSIDEIVADYRIEKARLCAFCDNHAEFYCDFILTWDKWGASLLRGKPYRHVASDALPHRCDAPICVSCRKQKGMMFWSPVMGGPDSVDHCPNHAEMDNTPLALLPEMSAGEVESMRLREWKMKHLQRVMKIS